VTDFATAFPGTVMNIGVPLTEDARHLDSVERGFAHCIRAALAFLVRAQRTTGCTDRERIGFGGSLFS
jgi:hypothetical protein